MLETTICYIEEKGQYLMLHRIKKKHDLNQGKWIGVGGKFEKDESPDECMRREIREETGLEVLAYRYCGIVTFVSDLYETEYMHLFTIQEYSGVIKECEEGVLEWVPKNTLSKLPHWDGDLIFLSLILDQERPFFSLKLVYRGDRLELAVLDGRRAFVTKHLLLLPLNRYMLQKTVLPDALASGYHSEHGDLLYEITEHDSDQAAGYLVAAAGPEKTVITGWMKKEFAEKGYLEEAEQAEWIQPAQSAG